MAACRNKFVPFNCTQCHDLPHQQHCNQSHALAAVQAHPRGHSQWRCVLASLSPTSSRSCDAIFPFHAALQTWQEVWDAQSKHCSAYRAWALLVKLQKQKSASDRCIHNNTVICVCATETDPNGIIRMHLLVWKAAKTCCCLLPAHHATHIHTASAAL
jgi:hypothetical protein